MNRKMFLMQLERLLADIPQEERMEALAYYDGYFEDAGQEEEGRILKELESPEKVAMKIKAGMGSEQYHEYTESAYYDNRFRERDAQVSTSYQKTTSFQEGQVEFGNRNRTAWIIVLIVTSPLWIGLLGAAFGVAVSILATVFALVVSVFAVTLALYVAGFAIGVSGIVALAGGGIATGLGLFGIGLLLLALAVLSTIACVWICGRGLPNLMRSITDLCRRMFRRKERVVV